MKKTLFLMAIILLPLTACAQNPNDPVRSVAAGPVTNAPAKPAVTPDMTAACNLPTSLVGQSGDVLKTMKFGGPVRILGPDSMMTMDYSPQRLNIIVGKDNVIKEVKCG